MWGSDVRSDLRSDLRRTAFTAILLLLATASVGAQGQAPAAQQPVFKSSTRLVIQNVYVKDKEGRPIQGLTAKDFVVFEDNQRQDIAFVEYQRIANDPVVDAPDAAAADAAPDAPAAGVQRVAN